MDKRVDVLKAIWTKQTNGLRPYFFISTKKKDNGKWQDHCFKWPNLSELSDLLKRYNTEEYNLYFCPLPFSKPYRRREFVIGSQLLWADIDEANPKDMAIPPHVLWESSPGRWAGLWMVERWLDNEECEIYNKRMTYGTGADKAGWDLTQVLRIPGTKNHKYKGSPTGKLIRMDLHKKLKLKEVPTEVSNTSAGRAKEVYEKWKGKLKGETRATLTSPQATEGKRSDVLWKLYHQMFDAGMALDEIRIVIKETVWNKFRERGRDEDKQLNRDIEKCLEEKLKDGGRKKKSDAALAREEEIYEGISADTIELEEIDWLWWPYISRRNLTIVEGDPGLGKSYFMQMVAGAVVDGGKLPGEGIGGVQKLDRGSVMYFSIEDDPATVIGPRLVHNNIKHLDKFRIYNRAITIDEDGLATAQALVKKYKVDLVVFDTLNYFIGGIDVHRSNEVAQQLEHFTRLARSQDVAVVVLRHLTKSKDSGVKGLYRGQGSITFTGTAREVLTVGIHPEDPDLRIVAVTKLNIESKPKAVGYKISSMGRGKSKFDWSDELYDITTDEIINVVPAKKGRTRDELKEAMEFLYQKLDKAAMEASQLEGLAEAVGISVKVLRRAKQEIGVVAEKRGHGNGAKWFWKIGEK